MASSYHLAVALAMFLTLSSAQRPLGLTGSTYIERQLLCALDQGPCDILGNQIKNALPEIIGNNCRRCDQTQYGNARRIAVFVQARYPDVWNALIKKYAPRPKK